MVMKTTTCQQCGKERNVSVMSLSPDPKIRDSHVSPAVGIGSARLGIFLENFET